MASGELAPGGRPGAHLICLDTSAVFALLNRREREHDALTRRLRSEQPPYLVPVAALGELSYLIEQRLGHAVLAAFVADLRVGRFVPDCGDADLDRVHELILRYADLPLGFVDAAVIACAERNGGRVLTLDRRHFTAVEREGTITVVS